MKGVEGDAQSYLIHFDHEEPGLLAGVVDQLTEILDDIQATTPAPATSPEQDEADPFAQWETEFSPQGPSWVDLGDPVVQRLFPEAYRGDPAASADFRRFTLQGQRDAKLRDARVVIGDLQATDRRGRCRVPSKHLGAWLKTLTGLRLVLAVRLEITDETSADEAAQRPENDPRAWLFEVYSWIGWLQECLLAA